MANAVRDVGANATILRIGQITGDTVSGVWNDSEVLPMIMRSAMTMGILPELDMRCEWLPVDTLAKCILQIAELDEEGGQKRDQDSGDAQLVYNLVSPYSFSWTTDLIPALSSAGLSFRPCSWETWIHRLRSFSLDPSSISPNESVNGSSNSTTLSATTPPVAAYPLLNPALKLIDFLEGPFMHDNAAGGDTSIKFSIVAAEEAAPALQKAPKVIESGLLAKMVQVWLRNWGVEDKGGKGE